MKISEFLSPDDVFVDLQCTAKHDVLRKIADRSAIRLRLDGAHILDELLRRESLGSTGIGDGTAIPHARIRGVANPFGLLLKLDRPIEFDAIDERPVDLVFALLLADGAGQDQLGALAAVARKLRSADMLERMRRTQTTAALFAIAAG